MSSDIAKILIDIKSVNFAFDNHFTLTSGLKSPVYVDCRRIISYVKEREFIFKKALNFVLQPTSRAAGFWGKSSALGLVDILTRVNTL